MSRKKFRDWGPKVQTAKMRDISRTIVAAAGGAIVVLLIQGALAGRARRPSAAGEGFPEHFGVSMSKLRNGYVEPLNHQAYWQQLTRCATETLDSYSYYLTPSQRERQTAPTPFGLSLARRPGQGKEGPLRVVHVEPEGVAHRAGLRRGMRVDAINGRGAQTFIKQADLDLALRPGHGFSLTLKMGGKRVELQPASQLPPHRPLLRTRTFHCGTQTGLYLHLARFDAGTAQKIRAAIENQADGAWEGVVLDLQGNPGGEIDQAVAVADLFLAKGIIARVRGRKGRMVQSYKASAPQTFSARVPLVLLVDTYTASAAELLSAALQDHGRALIVGDTTFGKGSIQAMHPFSDGSLLRYTTGRYYSPKDHAIDQRGVLPDLHWHTVKRGQPLADKSLCRLLSKAR